MTASRKTTGIILLAGAVAVAAVLLPAAPPKAEDLRSAKPDSAVQLTDPSGLTLGAGLSSSHVLVGTSETHMAVTIQAPHTDGQRARPAALPGWRGC